MIVASLEVLANPLPLSSVFCLGTGRVDLGRLACSGFFSSGMRRSLEPWDHRVWFLFEACGSGP